MGVLLQNTDKRPDRRVNDVGVSMGVNLSADTSRLEVCFGGFAPTAMNAGIALDEVVEAAEARMREYRLARERAAELDAARVVGLREWTDAGGSTWSYEVLASEAARIVRCWTEASQLEIPAAIEGLPVVALAADACAHLASVEQIVCPDGVLSVGFCAFRGCKSLRRLVLPAQAADFDSGWYRNCDKLEHLQLPGYVERLDPSIFDAPKLETLRIGAGTFGVAPGAFAKSALERVEVDEASPFLSTDGLAVYTKDGAALLALAVPVERYRVRGGCRRIARKGFSGFACLEQAELPETLEAVEPFAFANTGLRSFEGPAALRELGEKAFFNCRRLSQVSLAAGLRSVGRNAFTGTAITQLELPATVEHLESPLAAGTALTFAGENATFRFAKGEGPFTLDERGGLYRRDADGLAFALLLDPQAERYEVAPGTMRVVDGAFAGHARVREVALPEGLRVIGAGAFKGCRALRSVNMPESVVEIGDEAFLDTNIERLRLPVGLERLGANALITQGAHYSASVRAGRVQPSLREVEVGAGNPRFLMEGSLLLERAGTGEGLRVLLCTGGQDVVRIPSQVIEVAPYAFNNVRGIRELHLSDRIVVVGIRGLAMDGFVELIHVDLVRAHEGRASFELRFPETDRGIQQMMLALSVPDHVNVQALFEHYDTAVTNASSFDAAAEAGLPLYDQATRLIARLLDPVYLSKVNRQLAERFLANNAAEVCVALAKRDDRANLDAMLDLGFLNADNIYAVIDRMGAVQDASITNYLLEARRERFGQSVFDDFDL